MKLFSELGYEATTTNKIAELAGVSIGSLYHYFPNKDAILFELGIRHRKIIYRDIIKILRNSKEPNLREVLKTIVTKIVRLHRDNQLLIEALTVHTHIDKQLDAMKHDHDIKFWAAVGNIIRKKHMDSKLVINVENLKQAWIVLGKTGKDVIHNISMESIYGPDDKVIEGLVDAILSYMNTQSFPLQE
jgi:AcrR family transcriptional regulator